MLRKTNYNRPGDNSTTYEFNQSNQQSSYQTPKLRPTGRRFENNTDFAATNKFGQQQQEQRQQQQNSYSNNYTTNNQTSMEMADEDQGNNDEEEYEI